MNASMKEITHYLNVYAVMQISYYLCMLYCSDKLICNIWFDWTYDWQTKTASQPVNELEGQLNSNCLDNVSLQSIYCD